MKHVLITGAGGYVGNALAQAMAARLAQGGIASLTLTDRTLDEQAYAQSPELTLVHGDLGDEAVLAAATACAPDTVFHLAGITSRQAEEDFALGLRVNIGCTVALFEHLRRQGHHPIVVYASSIGVFGTPLPAEVDDDTPAAPTLSYGTQKRMAELLLADYSRRGWLNGRAVRLPTVVARPDAADAALSSFASSFMRALSEGRPYACPLGPDDRLWLLSLPACVEHLLQAAAAQDAALPAGRTWNLPAQRVSVDELVGAMRRRYGPAVDAGLRFEVQNELQAQFGRWPPLSTAIAESLGMRHDGNVDTLIERALAP